MIQIYENAFVQETRLISLSHKVLTVALCVFYFHVIEHYPLPEVLVQNSRALITFILWAHISSCFNLDFEPVWWQKLGSESKLQHIFRIAKVIFKYTNLVCFVILTAVWPLFSWLNFGMTQLDTDYYALRYFYYFLYMGSQNVPYSAIDNM